MVRLPAASGESSACIVRAPATRAALVGSACCSARSCRLVMKWLPHFRVDFRPPAACVPHLAYVMRRYAADWHELGEQVAHGHL